jgi:hypothetical protein
LLSGADRSCAPYRIVITGAFPPRVGYLALAPETDGLLSRGR